MDLSKVPDHAKAGLIAMNAGKPLAHTTPAEAAKEILDKYMDGESLIKQAEKLGLHPSRLNQILLQANEPEWKSAQIAKAMTSLEQYEAMIETASDGLNITRAREGARLAQWKLERLLARLFAQKQEVTHSTAPTFTINIGAQNGTNSGQPIDAEVIDNKG